MSAIPRGFCPDCGEPLGSLHISSIHPCGAVGDSVDPVIDATARWLAAYDAEDGKSTYDRHGEVYRENARRLIAALDDVCPRVSGPVRAVLEAADAELTAEGIARWSPPGSFEWSDVADKRAERRAAVEAWRATRKDDESEYHQFGPMDLTPEREAALRATRKDGAYRAVDGNGDPVAVYRVGPGWSSGPFPGAQKEPNG